MIEAIEAKARKFGSRATAEYASKYEPRSLDAELGDTEGFSLLDTLKKSGCSPSDWRKIRGTLTAAGGHISTGRDLTKAAHRVFDHGFLSRA